MKSLKLIFTALGFVVFNASYAQQIPFLFAADDTVRVDINEMNFHAKVKISLNQKETELGMGPVSRMYASHVKAGSDIVTINYRGREFESFRVSNGKDTITLKLHYHPAKEDKIAYNQANFLYSRSQQKKAVELYKRVTEISSRESLVTSSYYNLACYYALKRKKKKALAFLKKAVEHGYSNGQHMLEDADLASIRGKKSFKETYALLQAKRKSMSDPAQVKLVTSDIHHFWEAYDQAEKDPLHRKEIFNEVYFGKASPGLEDYFDNKIGNVDVFLRNLALKPAFYKAIRNNTLYVDKLKDSIRICLNNMKALYEDAVFPDIYFMIGRWSSAGTVSFNGLLIGTDQYAGGPGIPLNELNGWEKRNLKGVEQIPALVSHELIHFIQLKRDDTTLLSGALAEGMADFIGEKISGVNVLKWLHEFANKREAEIWKEFKSEMFLNRYNNWMGNGNNETPNRPADLGYYIGYKICEAYYSKAADKKQAIRDILEIRDAKKFWEASGYDPK